MPRTKLTKSVIDKLPLATDKSVTYFDDTLPGFGLRIGRSKKTFIVQRDIDRRTHTQTIGVYGVWTPEQARNAAREKLFLMSQGIDINQEQRKKRVETITLRELLEEFLEARKTLKEQTRKSYRWYMGFYLATWMDRPITDITEDRFYKRYVDIGANNGKTVANATRRILSALMNYSIAAYRVPDRNPVRIISDTRSGFPVIRRRTYIKPSQLKPWYEAVNNLPNRTYRDYLLLVLFTGMRRNEAAGLMWKDVDFNEKTITIPDTKNGEPLTLPMSDVVLELLEKRREIAKMSAYVFPGPGRSGRLCEPKKGVKAVCKASGIEFTVHDLRRSFVTYAESLDISSYALKAMLNHRTSDITGSYIILNVERLRKPMQAVSDYIKAQISTT